MLGCPTNQRADGGTGKLAPGKTMTRLRKTCRDGIGELFPTPFAVDEPCIDHNEGRDDRAATLKYQRKIRRFCTHAGRDANACRALSDLLARVEFTDSAIHCQSRSPV